MRSGYYFLPNENCRAFSAERIARAIVTHGISSLSDSENNALCIDPKFVKMVTALIYIIKKDNFLADYSQNEKATPSLDDMEKIEQFFDVWREENYLFIASTCVNLKKKKTILEIKRWENDNYNSPDFGSHDTLYWSDIEGNDEKEINNNILSIVSMFKSSKTLPKSLFTTLS
jgi:hypothetical protein